MTVESEVLCRTEFGGHQIELAPDRTACIPALETLLASDLHLGKAEAMRSDGSALPEGPDQEALRRLGDAVARCGASRLLVLGDLVHAPSRVSHRLEKVVQDWVSSVGCEVLLIEGNHDRGLRAQGKSWAGIPCIPELREHGLAFLHDPDDAESGQPAICGHIHPAASLGSGPRRVRVPAFMLEAHRLILPAMSRFTSGVVQAQAPGRILYACTESRVVQLPDCSGCGDA